MNTKQVIVHWWGFLKMPKPSLCYGFWFQYERQENDGTRSREISVKKHAVIHKYQGTWIVSAHRTKRERNHQGFPDVCDKGPESWIFKMVPPDEKFKGVAGNIKVRWAKFVFILGYCSVSLTQMPVYLVFHLKGKSLHITGVKIPHTSFSTTIFLDITYCIL